MSLAAHAAAWRPQGATLRFGIGQCRGRMAAALGWPCLINWFSATGSAPTSSTGAAGIATGEMLNLIVATKHLPRDDAYMLISAAMDLHLTQVVDGTNAFTP